MSELVLRNRQHARRVNTPLLRRIVLSLLADLAGVEDYEMGVHLVAATEIMRLNQTFLRHAGATDVITFDYTQNESTPDSSQAAKGASLASRSSPLRRGQGRVLRGEIYVCMHEAIRQARRFRTNWQSELVRYVIHGVLHLRGFDDRHPKARVKMKREETRLLRELTRSFPLNKLGSARLTRVA